ncbi:MAG TPA: pyridoxal phosphate-dependent aminotransferase [Gemmatimonadales bacterium]
MPPTRSTRPLRRQPAPRTNALTMEGAYEVAARVRALDTPARPIANLSIGEPSFATPGHIVEAGIRALRDGATRYAPVAGIDPLRAAIQDALRARGIAAAAMGNVIVTPGAKPALFYALHALVGDGDEVLIPDPGFPAYRAIVEFAGGVAVSYDSGVRSGIAASAGDLASRITPRTRVLVINSPGNPTGALAGERELAAIAQLAERHDLTILSDECYGQLLHDDRASAPSIAAVPGLAERTVVVDSFSKTYAMTGWRLGFALAPSHLVGAITRLAVNAHSCTPAFVQHAGVAALTGSQGPLLRMRRELTGRGDLLAAALDQLPGLRCARPGGAFYLFPDVSRAAARQGLRTVEFADWLLTEAGVATVAGTAFGPAGDGYLRFSFAAPTDQIALAIERLTALLGVAVQQ